MTPARTRRLIRSFLPVAGLALIACSAPERAGLEAEPQRSSAGMMRGGMPMLGMHRMMQGGMTGGGMMGGGMQDMRPIHGLLAGHETIERRVEDLPNGVRTFTTSSDPQVAALIRTHVRQMRGRFERGQPIRSMDPLFRELFERRDQARLEISDIPGGVEVLHTSSDPQVVLLIRQHARHFVSRAVERGMSAAMGPTPLPEGYEGR